MPDTPCERNVTSLLTEFRQTVERLEQVLREEQECIAKRLPEQLDALLQEKLRLLQDTEALDRRRAEYLVGIGLANDRAGMDGMLKTQPDAQVLTDEWNRTLESLRKCQALNEANGAVIRRGMLENQRLLDLLRGEESSASLCYGMDGGATGSGGRDLGKA